MHNSGTVEKRMKKAPIKAKNESNSTLFANFLTQSGAFCNFFTRYTSCAKVSIQVNGVLITKKPKRVSLPKAKLKLQRDEYEKPPLHLKTFDSLSII